MSGRHGAVLITIVLSLLIYHKLSVGDKEGHPIHPDNKRGCITRTKEHEKERNTAF
jgi:hypothetical protein